MISFAPTEARSAVWVAVVPWLAPWVTTLRPLRRVAQQDFEARISGIEVPQREGRRRWRSAAEPRANTSGDWICEGHSGRMRLGVLRANLNDPGSTVGKRLARIHGQQDEEPRRKANRAHP